MPELSDREREEVQRLLSKPIFFPTEFKSWVTDWFATNIPQIPIGQLLGGRGLPRFVGVSSQTASVGSTATETTLFSTELPGKRIAQDGQLKVRVAFTAMCTDVTNGVTAYLNINGTRVGTMSTLNTSDHLDGADRPGVIEFQLMNAGSYSSQYVGGAGGFDSQSGAYGLGAAGSGSVDSSADMTVTVSAKWDSAGGQLFRLLSASVEVFNPLGVA